MDQFIKIKIVDNKMIIFDLIEIRRLDKEGEIENFQIKVSLLNKSGAV